jgi:polyphosphate kinase
MRERLIGLIEREVENHDAGRPARVALKLNSLVDERVIDALYEASGNGVPVDLLVRGMCCLRPGFEGMSESIRVRSIVGRFLEHSRILYFCNGGHEELYTGSADAMHRNLDRRVEVLVRVDAPEPKQHMKDVLELAFSDNTSAWVLGRDGTWSRVAPGDDEAPVNHQEALMARARRDA